MAGTRASGCVPNRGLDLAARLRDPFRVVWRGREVEAGDFGGALSWVAVGTRVSPSPPHRSRRAELPHRALTLSDGVHRNDLRGEGGRFGDAGASGLCGDTFCSSSAASCDSSGTGCGSSGGTPRNGSIPSLRRSRARHNSHSTPGEPLPHAPCALISSWRRTFIDSPSSL